MDLEGQAKQRTSILGKSCMTVATQPMSDLRHACFISEQGPGRNLPPGEVHRVSIVVAESRPPRLFLLLPDCLYLCSVPPLPGKKCALSSTHQAVLGLQLNLQRVDCSSQINDV